MLMERLILLAMWVLGFVGLFLFIPHKDRRKGILAFLMFQAIIWLCDMPSFTFGFLSAPVLEFPKATDLPLTIDYWFYPVMFAIYYVHRKVKKNLAFKITNFLVWVSAVTLIDVMVERYTDLLKYGLLNWLLMWIYITFLFYVSQVCCNWFFKDKVTFQAERWEMR